MQSSVRIKKNLLKNKIDNTEKIDNSRNHTVLYHSNVICYTMPVTCKKTITF